MRKPVYIRGIRSNLEESLLIIYMRLFRQDHGLIELLANKFGKDEQLRVIFFETLEGLPALVEDESIVIEDELRAEFKNFMVSELQSKVLNITHIATSDVSDEAQVCEIIDEAEDLGQ